MSLLPSSSVLSTVWILVLLLLFGWHRLLHPSPLTDSSSLSRILPVHELVRSRLVPTRLLRTLRQPKPGDRKQNIVMEKTTGVVNRLKLITQLKWPRSLLTGLPHLKTVLRRVAGLQLPPRHQPSGVLMKTSGHGPPCFQLTIDNEGGESVI